MNLRKLLAILLALVVVLSFAACDGGGGSSSSDNGGTNNGGEGGNGGNGGGTAATWPVIYVGQNENLSDEYYINLMLKFVDESNGIYETTLIDKYEIEEDQIYEVEFTYTGNPRANGEISMTGDFGKGLMTLSAVIEDGILVFINQEFLREDLIEK